MNLRGIKYVLRVPAHFWIALFVFVAGFFVRQSVLHGTRISGLNESVNARLREDTEFFSCLSGLSDKNKLGGLISRYPDRTLYCANGKLILVGTIGIQNPLTPRKREYPKNPRDVSLKPLKENTGNACAYEDSGYINEPVVDIYYPFFDKKGDILYYYTTVLARDLLIYAPDYGDIRMSCAQSGKTGSGTLRLEMLNLYVTDTRTDGTGLLLSLVFFLAYALLVAILKCRKHAKRFSDLYLEHRSLAAVASESAKSVLYLHKIIQSGERFICAAAADVIAPQSIIRETLELLSSEISAKKMTVSSKNDDTGLTFLGTEFEWRLLLGAIVETVIKACPPQTRISYDVMAEEGSHIGIVFEDDSLIRLDTALNPFPDNETLKYFPMCDARRVVDHMGVYINIAASKDGGNLLMIAVPVQPEKSESMQRERSNVLMFNR